MIITRTEKRCSDGGSEDGNTPQSSQQRQQRTMSALQSLATDTYAPVAADDDTSQAPAPQRERAQTSMALVTAHAGCLIYTGETHPCILTICSSSSRQYRILTWAHLLHQQPCTVAQGYGHFMMVLPIHLLLDRQGSLVQSIRILVLALHKRRSSQ